MAAVEITKDQFEKMAVDADFDPDEIRWGSYNGRGYAKNCTGLVGSMANILAFFGFLGMASEREDSGIYGDDVWNLSERMGWDNMGRTDNIYYWTPDALKIVED